MEWGSTPQPSAILIKGDFITVQQLIDKLKELPPNAYVATYNDIDWYNKDDPE